MSEEVRGVVVGHGHLAEGLLDAVDEIAGTRGGLQALGVEGMTPETLEEQIDQLTGRGPAVVFVDLPSGSCAFAARRLQVQRPEIAVVCGVNLPLVLDFVFHRSLPLDELVERLRAHAGISIEHSSDADRSVQGR